MKELIDIDPLSGIKTWHHYDAHTDETTIEREQDAQPILDANKRVQNDPDYSRKGIKDSMWHVASIPTGLIEKWLKEDGINVFDRAHWPRVKRKLMDPDYRHLRTGLGNL